MIFGFRASSGRTNPEFSGHAPQAYSFRLRLFDLVLIDIVYMGGKRKWWLPMLQYDIIVSDVSRRRRSPRWSRCEADDVFVGRETRDAPNSKDCAA
jgi:hypothetical protein